MNSRHKEYGGMNEKANKALMGRRQFIREGLQKSLALTAIPSIFLTPFRSSAASVSYKNKPMLADDAVTSWKYASHLKTEEVKHFRMDLTSWTNTPRDKTYSYVAANLNPPYTATEIVYFLTVGQYFPWWVHESPLGGMMISNRGGLNFYTGQREFWSALTPDTLMDYLYRWPENKVYSWIWDRLYTPVRSRCDKLLQNICRTGKTYQKYSHKWSYFDYSQKTVPEGEALYSDEYWSRDYTYGDTTMVPWYYTWRYLGVDVLYEEDVVRFPATRTEIDIRNWDGKAVKKQTGQIRIMGDEYPAYTSNAGVPCYVLEGVTNPAFYSSESHRLILWVDMYACREIRRERYNRDNQLSVITEKRNRLELKTQGRWGYSILIHLAWDVKQDHMSVNHYDFHRPPQTFTVDPNKPEEYFRPNPIAMCSEMFPVPFSTMVFREPEQFYLRPKLMYEKFPEDRNIDIEDRVKRLIDAQENTRQLVFL